MKQAITLALALGLALPAFAQLSLSGRVIGGPKQEPLPFASVFLANTTKGTTTDEKGNFTLTNVPDGKYDLTVSFLGYSTLRTTVQTRDTKTYRFHLKPLEVQLNAVKVKARRRDDPDRPRQLALFKNYFIGATDNAKQCTLLNPQVLTFRQAGDTLWAEASDLLVIKNEALGYTLNIQLSNFEYNDRTNSVIYDISPVFLPLQPADSVQTNRWIANRKRAYRGSIMHFMRALYKDQLEQEGFLVQRVVEKPGKYTPRLVALPPAKTVSVRSLVNDKKWIEHPTDLRKILLDTLQSTPTRPILSFSDFVQVVYVNEKEPLAYRNARNSLQAGHAINPQKSMVWLLKQGIAVEANGHFWPALGVKSRGYWSWELIGDELPFDYDPSLNSL